MNYEALPVRDVIERTIAAMKPLNFSAQLVETRQQALTVVKNLIPAGGEVMTGASVTLEQIGFVALLKSGQHPWKNLKDALLAEKDPGKQAALRCQATLAEYFLGSVHAITEAGQTVTASLSGSQIPSYAYSSPNVIWVAGVQKIVPTLDDAFRRVREYVLPLEDKRMKSLGLPGSMIGKILIFEREPLPSRHISLILVNEKLGF
jgi:hypothetical protein